MIAPVVRAGHRIGNELYQAAFPIYRPLYRVFKAVADRDERRLLGRYLSPGAVVVDAGANIGIYAQFLAQRVGATGLVHAFEPSPENFVRLRQTMKNMPNVRANQMTLSDKTGESLLYISDNLNVDHRAYPTTGDSRRTVTIRSTTLDDYFKPGDRVDLIKMDIQGFELHALRGARRVLDDNPGVALLLEFWPYGLKQAGGSGGELVSFLKGQRFLLYLPAKGGLKRYHNPVAYTEAQANYFNLFAMREARASSR